MDKKLIDDFTSLILKYSKVHNITGSKTPQEILENIQDSLHPLKFLIQAPKIGLDIGTGAGFPGLILAMEMPGTKFFLVEPLPKRVSFLLLAKAELGLSNVEVIPKKIEQIAPFEADLITSRAVCATRDLLEMAKPFVKNDTQLIFYKGEAVQDEIVGLNHRIFERGKRKYLFLKGEDVS